VSRLIFPLLETERSAVFDAGCSYPGADAVLDPDRYCHGANAPALALEVCQDPAAFPLLDSFDVELGQLVPPQSAADQQGQDHVIPFALERRAVGDSQQLFRLLASQPVPQCR
jgi:hypothetical protein